MDKAILFLLPLFALALIMIPLILMIKRRHDGKPVKAKKAILLNAGSFIGVMILMSIFVPVFAFAAEEGAQAVQTTLGIGEGLKYLSAAISTGLATIGTGIAVGCAAPAAIGATSEDDKNFTKSLIFVALGEGVAIYGLLISILILFS
ncbi:MAG: hypothetical protein E7490_01365 [Ruminococcaceae bacterium]|nr:hypothetical protein [Oscillospiraceae bacterium]